jgi:ABC-type lipoprotein export system ATPase subunit
LTDHYNYDPARDLGKAEYFETTPSQQTFKELGLAIKDGKLVGLSGIVGSGKSTTLLRIQDNVVTQSILCEPIM